MKRPAIVFLRVFATSVLATALPSFAFALPTSRCADCHFANRVAASMWHLSEWDHSAHGSAGVGCERCHGGDATTFEPFLAHQSMLSATNPASPLHRMNLPKTCGGCHPGPFAAFQKSRHYELLREGNRDTPTCVTCHGSVGAYLLSPKALASECTSCHGPDKVAPRHDYPAEGRLMLTSIREVRQQLDDARSLIRKVKDKTRRAALELELSDAREPLREAVDSAHMFVFDRMQERLRAARTRAEMLAEEIANPSPLPSPQSSPHS